MLRDLPLLRGRLDAGEGDEAAVHRENCPRHEFRGVCEEVVQRTEQFIRISKASKRGVRNDCVAAVSQRAILVGEQSAVLLAKEKPGHDGIDAHFASGAAGHVHGQPASEIVHAGLGRRIADDSRDRAERRDGRIIDDRATSAFDHGGGENERGEDGAVEVEIHNLLERLEVEIRETFIWRDRCTWHVAASSVEQAVDAAPLFHDDVACALQRRAVEDVGNQAKALGTRGGGFAFGERGVEFILAAAEVNDAGSLRGEVIRRRSCEGSGGAGDEKNTSGEVE